MADIIKYANKNLNDPINEFDTLIGSSIVTKKTKNFTLKALVAFIKADLATNTEKSIVSGTPTYDVDGGIIY